MASVANSNRTEGAAARELILELKRHSNNTLKAGQQATSIPPYNLKLVRQCLDDFHSTYQKLDDAFRASEGEKPSLESRPSMKYWQSILERQKRCLLAYHHHRMMMLKQRVVEGDEQDLMSLTTNEYEQDFVTQYQSLRQRYLAAVLPDASHDHVLNKDLPPPASSSQGNALQVRCCKTLGQVVLESGRAVTLIRGSVLYLPRQDVLEFLKDGTLECIEGEEVDF
mmetsp:Transcript_34515/g.99382  ORF Transcript_34515/g.99382 Transcript_34515/m.99382 type:complete len:225 (-) Transcript_34515:128-802(-)